MLLIFSNRDIDPENISHQYWNHILLLSRTRKDVEKKQEFIIVKSNFFIDQGIGWFNYHRSFLRDDERNSLIFSFMSEKCERNNHLQNEVADFLQTVHSFDDPKNHKSVAQSIHRQVKDFDPGSCCSFSISQPNDKLSICLRVSQLLDYVFQAKQTVK